MTQTHELREYPIPRLCIVLPKEEDSTVSEKLGRGFRNSADVANKPSAINNNNSTTNISSSRDTGSAKLRHVMHEVHVARHEGYDLDHPIEFFEKYGTYALTLLHMLKYGAAIAGVVVFPLAQLSLGDSVDAMQKGADNLFNDMSLRVNNAIKTLQGLSAAPDQSSDKDRDGERGAVSDQLSGLKALEDADLRQLGTFLRNKDDARVFGNLYRIVASDGHVKWVCLDHCRQNYRSKTMHEIKDIVESNNGRYDEHTGRVTVKLASPITARQFYSALAQSRFVNELEELWELKGAIQHSNVVHFKLTDGDGQGPFSNILHRARRSDPINQLMAAVFKVLDLDEAAEIIQHAVEFCNLRLRLQQHPAL
ncbi:hypothetical protein BGZ47_005160 [Haplosporangium gracile]|nr:hypothetical protein BGZ47_005160 [Haplosporangium gracile]